MKKRIFIVVLSAVIIVLSGYFLATQCPHNYPFALEWFAMSYCVLMAGFVSVAIYSLISSYIKND